MDESRKLYLNIIVNDKLQLLKECSLLFRVFTLECIWK